jgi:hypothetical protein
MMSTMDAALPPSEVRRSVAIEFLFLDASTCRRCSATGANLDTALDAIDGVLQATGTRVELRRTEVRSAEQARQLAFVSSPTIRVNGRDIAPEPIESECSADGCGCAAGASCRLWRYRGRTYTEAPVGLIVDAVIAAVCAEAPRAESPAAYELPDNFARVFAANGGGCCG